MGPPSYKKFLSFERLFAFGLNPIKTREVQPLIRVDGNILIISIGYHKAHGMFDLLPMCIVISIWKIPTITTYFIYFLKST